MSSISTDENHWLNKLSKSRFFTSNKDLELLRYLIRSTYEGKHLKETIIAIEFFGRDTSFDPGSDSIVRSNIYNLRKKLESYYLDEGAEDEMRFIIPKGAYRVKTEVVKKEVPKDDIKQVTPKQIGLKVLLLVFFLSSLVLAFLYFRDFGSAGIRQSPKASKVWDYYLSSKNPLLIVLGDYFMMQRTEWSDSTSSYVRYPEINNQTEFLNFLNFLNGNPEQVNSLKKLGQTYFGEEIPKCFLQVISLFGTMHKPLSVKYSSELSLADIRENDIIFIGDFATLNILNPFFEKTGFHFTNSPQAVYIINEQNDTTGHYALNNPDQSVFQNDYAVVASVESYPGKRVLFLSSFLPFGKSEALFKLQEPGFITELSEGAVDFPLEWTLLMKISGLKSSGFYYEVIDFSE